MLTHSLIKRKELLIVKKNYIGLLCLKKVYPYSYAKHHKKEICHMGNCSLYGGKKRMITENEYIVVIIKTSNTLIILIQIFNSIPNSCSSSKIRLQISLNVGIRSLLFNRLHLNINGT